MDLCHGLAIPDYIIEKVIKHSFYERVGRDFEAPLGNILVPLPYLAIYISAELFCNKRIFLTRSENKRENSL